jgi:hypothetical protein
MPTKNATANRPSCRCLIEYIVRLQAVNYATLSLSYTLELEEKLVARDTEVVALRAQLEEAQAKLAAVKRPTGLVD